MKDFTEIVVVLDKSGSMTPIKGDTISSFNGFVADQAKIGHNAALSLYLFDNRAQVVYEGVKINEVKPLDDRTYVPYGGTALNDAMGKAIDELGIRLAKTKESDRPDKVVFVVMTDGEENSSGLFNVNQIKEKVKHQESVYKWQFLFLGAGIDAFAAGGGYGISVNNILNISKDINGLNFAAQSNTRAISKYRNNLTANCSYVQPETKSAEDIFPSKTSVVNKP